MWHHTAAGSKWSRLTDNVAEDEEDLFMEAPRRSPSQQHQQQQQQHETARAAPSSAMKRIVSTPTVRCPSCSVIVPEGQAMCNICNRELLNKSTQAIVVSLDHDDEVESEVGTAQDIGEWTCEVCTFINPDPNLASCEVCESVRAQEVAISRKMKPDVHATASPAAVQNHTANLVRTATQSSIKVTGIPRSVDINSREDVYINSGDDFSEYLSEEEEDDSVEDFDEAGYISGAEYEPYSEALVSNSFNAFSGGSAAVRSSYADDEDLIHIVSVADLRRTPGATAIDFSKFCFVDTGRPNNLKYEKRKDARLKKMTTKKKSTAKRKVYGTPAYKKRKK